MFKIIKEVGWKKFLAAGFMELYRKIYLEFILGSYSQNGEDLIMEKLLPEKGYYLEIGGYHPTRLSNTYRFYKKGWRGVVVEPNPEIKTLFTIKRPRDKFINFGVGNRNGVLKYYRYLIPALNTFSKKAVEENIHFKVNQVNHIKVMAIKKFLNKYIHKNIDLLSLDVEGWDEKILTAWDWKYKPKVICVETDEAAEILFRQKYKLFKTTKFNKIYVL